VGNAGWSHFAQFTIAVVNKDPKKSKYSGVLVNNCFGYWCYNFLNSIANLVFVSFFRHIAPILEEGA
jgi:hypothetical protein